MSREDIYKVLEKEFVSTFIDELIPGMLHNFANPLNGIIGRSKLLQKRIEENIKKIRENYPEAASEMMEDHRKMKADIETISHESDKFFSLFRNVAEKFYIIAAPEKERLNLSRVIETEMRFADLYLDFKHDIKKELQLDEYLPEITGFAADYSMFVWALITYSKNRMKTCSVKEFSVSTTHDDRYVCLTMRDTGCVMPEEQKKILLDCLSSDGAISPEPKVDSGLLHALLLLKKYNAHVQMQCQDGCDVISVKIPYNSSRSSGGN